MTGLAWLKRHWPGATTSELHRHSTQREVYLGRSETRARRSRQIHRLRVQRLHVDILGSQALDSVGVHGRLLTELLGKGHLPRILEDVGRVLLLGHLRHHGCPSCMTASGSTTASGSMAASGSATVSGSMTPM